MEFDDSGNSEEPFNMLAKRVQYMKDQEKFSTNEIMEILHNHGIELTVEEVLDEYRKSWDIEETARAVAGRYEDCYDDSSTFPDDFFNEDLFVLLVKKTVRENIGETESGDEWFISELSERLEEKDLRRVRQSEVEDLIRMLITNSRNRDNHLLARVGDVTCDYNESLIELMPACRNRSSAFQELMQEFFECYEDADPAIYPSLYRSMYGSVDASPSHQEKDRDENEIIQRMADGMQRFRNLVGKIEAQRKMPVSEILRFLNKNGIDLSEERILKDYERINSVDDLSEKYWKEYADQFEQLDDDTGMIDEDILLPLVDKVVRANRDIVETGDLYFADELILELEKKKAKDIRQEEVEMLVAILIRFSETHDCHRFRDINRYYNYDVCLIDYVKSCHNRNLQFNQLMTHFYECYEDADPNVYPSLYRRIKGKK